MAQVVGWLAAGLLAAVVILLWKMRCLKGDIVVFTEKLEQCLDHMIQGKKLEDGAEPEDSLWGKVYDRLERLNDMWERQHGENLEEKRQIKELVSDISHQTKTPVANMKIYLDILQGEEGCSGRQRAFLQKLNGQVEKLEFLLNSLVKMSRLETGIIEVRREKGYILETLGKAVAAVVPGAEKKHIRLYVDCGEDIVVSHDRKWTEEAVFNVLDNAVKYTPDGGKIRVEVSVQEFFVKISVKDTGKGIARDRQSQVFRRFYREPEVHGEEGIGVGLYLARKIVERQRGYMEVRSEEGEGADFQLYLSRE